MALTALLTAWQRGRPRPGAPMVVRDRGDRDVEFERLARENEPLLRAVARRLTGSDADAHDLVQDTLERALRHFDRFARGTNARAWLFTILHNLFIDRCRARRPEARAQPVEDVPLAAPELEPPPAWTQVTAEQVRDAVARLEPEFRTVYELRTLDGLSYDDIATRLGIPKATVGTRLSRARTRLRALLEPLVAEGGGAP